MKFKVGDTVTTAQPRLSELGRVMTVIAVNDVEVKTVHFDSSGLIIYGRYYAEELCLTGPVASQLPVKL